jgi:hypothetical protein
VIVFAHPVPIRATVLEVDWRSAGLKAGAGALRDHHERWLRDAMDAAWRRKTSDTRADGKVVWSCPPDAGVKFCRIILRGDGGKRARSPGRARYKPQNHRAGNAGDCGLPLATTLVCFFHSHAGLWVRAKAPGIPCALLVLEGGLLKETRACCAARTLMHVAVIARSESDEAIQIVAMELWIGSAQPVIGRAFARPVGSQ